MEKFTEAIKNISEQFIQMETEEKKSLDEFAKTLPPLARKINETTIKHRHELGITKERFNVFDCLPRTHLEALHSNFLAYLLNPQESHDCGDWFLKIFVDKFVNGKGHFENQNFDLDNADKNIKVQTEKTLSNSQRRMDIVIENKKKNQRVCIENKIWAGDQDSQLKAYHKDLESRFPEKFILFYLTPWVKDASKESKKELIKDKDYFCLSYNDDILSWLKECIEKCWKYPFVTSGIFYYQKLLERKILSIDGGLMSKVQKILLENPEVLKHLRASHIKGLEKELKEELLEGIIYKFSEGNWYEGAKSEEWNYHYKDKKRIFSEKKFSFYIELNNDKKISGKYLKFGICDHFKNDREIQQKLIKSFADKKKNVVCTDYWVCNEEQPPIFQNKSDDENLTYILAQVKNKDNMKELVDEVFDFILPYYEAWIEISKESKTS